MNIMSPEKKWVKSWSRGKKKTQAPLKNKAIWVLHNHYPQPQQSRLHTVEIAPFRLRMKSMKYPPPAVIDFIFNPMEATGFSLYSGKY